MAAADVLPDLAGVRPGVAGFAGGTLVYNPRTVNGGPLHDPTALMYVLESDLEPIDPTDPRCIALTGNPRNPRERVDVMQPGCPVRLRADAPVEPLILRANAGDCLRVELFNKLLGQAIDATGAFCGFDPIGGEVWDSTDWASWRNRTAVLLEALFPARGDGTPAELARWVTEE